MTDENFDKRLEDWAAREVETAPELEPTTEMYRLVELKGKRARAFWNKPRWAVTAGVILAVLVLLIIGGLILGDLVAWFRPTTVQQVAFVEVREGQDFHSEPPEKGKGKGVSSFQQLTFQVHRQIDGMVESLEIRESIKKPIHLTTTDDFRLLLQPAQLRYLYMYLVNPTDDYMALHPETGFNPLHPLVTTLLPDQLNWFYLTGERGVYRLLLVTATHEIPELDERYNQYLQQIASPDYESTRNALSEYLESISTNNSKDLDIWELTLIFEN